MNTKEYLEGIIDRCAEEEWKNSDAPKVLKKIMDDCAYWGCTVRVDYNEELNECTIYLKVPEESQLLEDIEGDDHYKQVAGINAAKLIKRKFLDYFNSNGLMSSNVTIKYKINPNIDLWTTEMADIALKRRLEAAK